MSGIGMTRDYARQRARDMREREINLLKIGRDPKQSFEARYAANVQAEDFEEAARRFDRVAEREKAK